MIKQTMLVTLITTVVGCAATPISTKEFLDWDPVGFSSVFQEKTGWKGIEGKDTLTTIYAKDGETSENWSIKLEITNLPIAITSMNPRIRWKPDSVMASENKNCSDWEVLSRNESSILYERKNISCPSYLHGQEIGRIVMGKFNLWWISYGIRDRRLSGDERASFIAHLKQASVAVRGQ